MMLFGLLGQVARDGYGGHHWDDAWMWLWGPLMMLAIVALVGGVVWSLFRRERVERDVDARRGSASRAREILDERYARGEIDSDEHREKARHLEERS